MKIVCISDTHNQHHNKGLILPEGDCIIHAGDVSGRGYRDEIVNFLEWFSKLPYEYKIFIAGNHDFYFEDKSVGEVNELLSKYPEIIYLNDSGVTIEGVKIYGSPVQPWFYNWAFNRRGTDICKHWDLIPLDTQVLITHGPVHGYLDLTLGGDITGCPFLLEKIKELKDLKLEIHGHIHEAYGHYEFADNTFFINASVLDTNYVMKNKPYLIDFDQITKKVTILK